MRTVNRVTRIKQKKEIARKIQLASIALQIPEGTLKGTDRTIPIANGRHFIMYYLRAEKYPLLSIGAALNRDHSTVISAVKKVNDIISVDQDYTEQYLTFKQQMDRLISAQYAA